MFSNDDLLSPGPTKDGLFRVNIVVSFSVDESVSKDVNDELVDGFGPFNTLGSAVSDAVTTALKTWDEAGIHPQGQMFVFAGDGTSTYPVRAVIERGLPNRKNPRGSGDRRPLPAHTLAIWLESGDTDAHIRFEVVAPQTPWHIKELYLRPGWGSQVRVEGEEFERVPLLEDHTLTEEFTKFDFNIPAPIAEDAMYSLIIVDELGTHDHPCPGRTKRER